MRKNITSFLILLAGTLLVLSAQRYYILEVVSFSGEEITSLTDTPESSETEKSWDDEVMITTHQVPKRFLLAVQQLYVHEPRPLPLISLTRHLPPPNND